MSQITGWRHNWGYVTAISRWERSQKENDMVIAIIVMLALMALMMMALYAMLVVASRADERADRMYRKWKEEHDDRT